MKTNNLTIEYPPLTTIPGLAFRHFAGEDNYQIMLALWLACRESFFFEMVRPIDKEIPECPLPQGIEIRSVEEKHLRQIFDAENEATRDYWGHIEYGEEQFHAWLDDRRCQPHLWKVAWQGDEVCGMVRNYIDELENQTQQRLRGYTEFISVRRHWRRKGLASALLADSIAMFTRLGMQETALGVDTENPSSALTLYQNMGDTENRDKTYLIITKPFGTPLNN